VGKCSDSEQRLRFALALLPDPQLLILDKPTAGMDAGARREFWETMHAETSEGRTVVFATHYLEEAQAYAPRTILIVQGRIRADSPTDQLRAMVGERTVTASLPEDGRDSQRSRASYPVQPSSLMAHPAFQILVMWLILPPWNSIT
jgi:ABC-2 type transport system ATP-binding protein